MLFYGLFKQCWLCQMSWLVLHIFYYWAFEVRCDAAETAKWDFHTGKGITVNAVVTARQSASENQRVWPTLSSARLSQAAILLLLWWVWLMTSSGPCCHVAPYPNAHTHTHLLFCQQHLLGPITGLDHAPIGGPELAWITSKAYFLCTCVCVCVHFFRTRSVLSLLSSNVHHS